MHSLLFLVGALATSIVAIACSSDNTDDAAIEPQPSPVGDASSSPQLNDRHSGETGANDASADAPHVPLPIPKLVSTSQLCKLINKEKNDDPTANKTHFTANIKGTDLGIPVVHNDTLYVFFGDTVGFRGIWDFGESQPDAVGFSAVSATEVAKNPSTLCTNLRFLTLPANQSVGPGQDSRITADFAGGVMNPPAGHSIGEYIHNGAGKGAFPNIPGDFEVPSGAFSYDGSIWLFYTTVVSNEVVNMKGSYLAKWVAPTTTGVPAYDILYDVDQRFDANGPMHGDFINIAAVVHGDFVYLYGTGEYRASKVHLARKKLTTLASPGGFERYDAQTKTWKAQNEIVTPIVDQTGNGEMSVRYYPSIKRFMMLNQEQTATSNRVVARFSESPEGPWSAAIIVHDMGDPAFSSKYCCASTTACTGEQLFHCDAPAGFYGTYLLPDVTVVSGNGSKFVATYTMSTWDPYNVALMEATFE